MSPNTQTTISQRVPFSWENHPGTPLQKEKENENEKALVPVPTEDTQNTLKLPPPPSLQSNHKPFHGLYVPLPPCPFQPPEKISPSSDDQDDPFLLAYLECTKSVKHVRPGSEDKKKDLWRKMKRVGVQIGIRLACNSNRHVRDDDHDMRPLPQINEID